MYLLAKCTELQLIFNIFFKKELKVRRIQQVQMYSFIGTISEPWTINYYSFQIAIEKEKNWIEGAFDIMKITSMKKYPLIETQIGE